MSVKLSGRSSGHFGAFFLFLEVRFVRVRLILETGFLTLWEKSTGVGGSFFRAASLGSLGIGPL